MTAKGGEAVQGVDFIEVRPDGSPYFCDWYACLVDETPDNIMEALDGPMGLVEVKPCPGVPQYERSVALWSHHSSDRALFELSFGGNQGASPHLVSKGYVAHEAMTVLRRVFPSHRVSRMDVAVDLKPKVPGFDVYGAVSEILKELRDEFGLKARTINHDLPQFGRTHYLGSRQSPAMVRVYEKDKEQASKGLSYIPGNVRVELESKPQKRPERARWASVSLEEAWGVSRWTRQLADRVLSLDVQPIRRAQAVKHSDQDTFQNILNQHSKLIQRLDEEEAVAMLRAIYSHGRDGLHKKRLDDQAEELRKGSVTLQ